MSTTTISPVRSDVLPAWSSVLAVVAHPDDESFGLGAVLDAFRRAGATVSVLCLTHGEASALRGVSGDLAELREREFRDAAEALGVRTATLLEYADGELGRAAEALVEEVVAAAAETKAEGLVVFDRTGVTGHADHVAATAAAVRAAERLELPVLGWTVPTSVARQLNEELDTTFVGSDPDVVDLAVPVDRDRQRIASLAHASQAIPTSVLWRRLELLGDVEHLRWLHRPGVARIQVDHRGGDRFDIGIRSHVVTVDQPESAGGEDVGPTPTELFVAGLASCVAFYARRYLRRHHLPEEGLAVEATYTMASKPARVGGVDLRIRVPEGLPDERRDGLLAVASHCTVHNSITSAPEIAVTLG